MFRDTETALTPNVISLREIQDQLDCFFQWIQNPPPKHAEMAVAALHFFRNFKDFVIPNKNPEILVLNKPAGLLTYSGFSGELFGVAEIARLASKNRCIEALHRLDTHTSGILVLGKTVSIRREVRNSFEKRKIKKEYITILKGDVSDKITIVNAAISAGKQKPSMVTTQENPKHAESRIKVLAKVRDEEGNIFSILKVRILTGRTHQIRVHMSEVLGAPVVGDTEYGSAQNYAPRQLLHAYHLNLWDTEDKEILDCVAPIPPDFYAFLSNKELIQFDPEYLSIFSFQRPSA
jgi:RluA family pseudouridine synthase